MSRDLMTKNTNRTPSERMFHAANLRQSHRAPFADKRPQPYVPTEGADSNGRAVFSAGVYGLGPLPVHVVRAFTDPLHASLELARIRAVLGDAVELHHGTRAGRRVASPSAGGGR